MNEKLDHFVAENISNIEVDTDENNTHNNNDK